MNISNFCFRCIHPWYLLAWNLLVSVVTCLIEPGNHHSDLNFTCNSNQPVKIQSPNFSEPTNNQMTFDCNKPMPCTTVCYDAESCKTDTKSRPNDWISGIRCHQEKDKSKCQLRCCRSATHRTTRCEKRKIGDQTVDMDRSVIKEINVETKTTELCHYEKVENFTCPVPPNTPAQSDTGGGGNEGLLGLLGLLGLIALASKDTSTTLAAGVTTTTTTCVPVANSNTPTCGCVLSGLSVIGCVMNNCGGQCTSASQCCSPTISFPIVGSLVFPTICNSGTCIGVVPSFGKAFITGCAACAGTTPNCWVDQSIKFFQCAP